MRTLSAQPTRRGVAGTAARLTRPHRRVLVAGVVATTFASVVTLVGVALIGRLADAALRGDERQALSLGAAAVVLAVLQVVATGVGQAWLARAGEYVVRDLREGIVVRLLAAPLRFVERHRTGDLVQRGTAEVAALSSFVRESLAQTVTTGSTIVAAVVVLSVESWQLMLATLLGFGPASWWLMRRFRSAAPTAFAAEADAEADVMAGVAEVVRTRSVLRQASLTGRRRLLANLDTQGEAAFAAQMRTVVVARWVNAMALVECLSLAALLGLGTALVASDAISVGVVVTFVLASRTVFTAFSDLSELVAAAEEAATGLARAQDLLEATTPLPTTDEAPSDRTLVARGLGFAYEHERVVDGVDLVVEPGDRVCLVGRTGSGKSTVAKLLAGLYEPDAGAVTIGGVDVASLPVAARSRLVAYVPQQVQLGPGTVRDELLLAAPDADDGMLRDAAARLGLGAWLAGLQEELDTIAGDGLSAGERQLVGLVRVALSDAAVLVLDEATSDLDATTALLVERAIDGLAVDRAVVVVAHRPETIAAFDHIVDLGALVSRT